MNPALERKLKVIYDLIDNKQYKKALKQCNSLQQKSPNPYVIALRAAILQKQNYHQESLEILDSLFSENPTDQQLIDLMVITYKVLGQTEKINSLYHRLFNVNPTKETGELLFNSYSACFNYEKQQQIAMKLFKTHENVKYALYAVQSMVLQGSKSSLNIAWMLLQKIKGKSGFKPVVEVSLLEVSIEERRRNYENVLNIIENSVGEINVLEYYDIKLRTLRKCRDVWDLLNTYTELFELNSSENTAVMVWSCYRDYIELVFSISNQVKLDLSELNIDNPDESLTVVDSSVSGKELVLKLWRYINRFKKKVEWGTMTGRNLKRTSRLAELHIIKKMLELEILTTDVVTSLLTRKLGKYLVKHYDIPSTVQDISLYLSKLSLEESAELLSITEPLHIEINSIDDIRRSTTYWKLKFRLGHEITMNDLKAMEESYTKTLLIEPEPKKGEQRLGDIFILIISRSLLNTPNVICNWSSVFSVHLLESAISVSPFNYFLKLQLIELYKALGLYKLAFDLYSTLDIKSVQHESLGHIVLGELNDWRVWKNELNNACASIQDFNRYSRLDLGTSIQNAYKYTHPEQVLDFQKFNEKLDKSYSFLLSKMIKIYESIGKNTDVWDQMKNGLSVIELMPKEYYENVCDLSVLKEYVYIPLKNSEMKESQEANIYGRWTRYESVCVEFLALKILNAIKQQNFSETETLLVSFTELNFSFKKDFYSDAFIFLGKLFEFLLTQLSQDSTKIQESYLSIEESINVIDQYIQSVEPVNTEDLKPIAFTLNTIIPLSNLSTQLIDYSNRTHTEGIILKLRELIVTCETTLASPLPIPSNLEIPQEFSSVSLSSVLSVVHLEVSSLYTLLKAEASSMKKVLL